MASKRVGKRRWYRPGPINHTLRRLFALGAITIVMFFGALGLFGDNGVLDTLHLKNLHHNLQSENTTLIEEQEGLQMEIAKLKDARYIEFLARDRLGLMGAHEIFIVMDTESTHSVVDNSQ